MIAMLRGVLADKQPDQAILDVGGVGYRVFIPLSTYAGLPAVGEATRLHTVTQVREDAFHLFGFLTREEKQLFQLLIGVTGIGARLALAALSALNPEELASALAQEDITRLSRIAGVGRKTAQRMAMELKDKVAAIGGTLATPGVTLPTTGGTPLPATLREELASALTNLGYRRPQVDPVVSQVLNTPEGNDLGLALRAALKLLSG